MASLCRASEPPFIALCRISRTPTSDCSAGRRVRRVRQRRTVPMAQPYGEKTRLVARKEYAVAVVKLCAVAQPDVLWHWQEVVAAALRGVRRASTGGAARALGVWCALALGREKGEHASTVSDCDCRHAGAASLLRTRGPARRVRVRTRRRRLRDNVQTLHAPSDRQRRSQRQGTATQTAPGSTARPDDTVDRRSWSTSCPSESARRRRTGRRRLQT